MDNFIAKHLKALVGGVFLFVGVAFFVVGVGLYVTFNRFSETALPTQAVITEIRATGTTGSGRRRSTTYSVYVRYEVDGKRYSERLPEYSSGMEEGQQLEILYNPEAPAEIHTRSGGLFTLIFVGIGALFACIGGVLTYLVLKKRRRVRRLLAEGRTVTADVLEIYRDTSMVVKSGSRRKNPWRIRCVWTNPADGLQQEFESDAIWNNPGELSSVTVHINPSDPQEYYVAVN